MATNKRAWSRGQRWCAASAMTVVVVAGIGAVPAQAAPEGTPDDLYAVSTDLAHGDFAGDTAARDEVLSRVGQSDQLDDILAANVPATLDLSDLDADVQNATWVGQDQALEDAFRGLPETDERTGEVTLRASDNQREFSIAPLGSSRGNDEGGAVVTSVGGGDVTAVSHITEDLRGQIVAVADSESVHYVDFEVDIPTGYSLSLTESGSVDLLDSSGAMMGRIEAPWAFDETGARISTHFELRNGVVRQYFDAEAANGKVVVDPAWWWWVGTTAQCAVSVAPLLVASGPVIAVKLARVVSKINKLKSTNSRFAAAVKKIGGTGPAAKALLKKAVMDLRGKLPEGVRSKMPSVKLDPKEKAFIAVAWTFFWEQIWDLIGLGSCASLIREIRR